MKYNEEIKTIKELTTEVITEEELINKLKISKKEKKPLIIKAGFDPTTPDLHLGHTVLLQKLRTFQSLGHKVVFIVGDFTALIGDPSGRNETRKPITREEIEKNSQTYQEQAFTILDRDNTEVVYNSRWMDKMTASELLELASKHTVARILERDDFSGRYKNGNPIGIHELLYPIIQAYDSVVVRADVELGGTDQKFNLLVGRAMQRDLGQQPQAIITMPILEGLDGVNKMSKSLGNCVGIKESPKEMFGKIMSISDDLMMRYYRLLTDMSDNEIKELDNKIKDGTIHPMKTKQKLGEIIVGRFHSKEDAKIAEREFIRQFSRREVPLEIPEVSVEWKKSSPIWIGNLLKMVKATCSTSEAKRKIREGAVKLDGVKVKDENLEIPAKGEVLVQIGRKKNYRVTFTKIDNISSKKR